MGRYSGFTSRGLCGTPVSSSGPFGDWVGERPSLSAERLYPGPTRLASSFWISNGGNLLKRLPFCFSSNLLARIRDCMAKASRGDRAGGTSPVRGEAVSWTNWAGRPLRASLEPGRRSKSFGRFGGMVVLAREWQRQ